MMRIAVVSDTHGHVGYTSAAVELIRREAVDAVLHCGDIGSSAIVGLFEDWSTHFVFGNVDDEQGSLTAVIRDAGQTCHGRFGAFELAGTKIALLHSDDRARFEETISCGDYDLVCYGHTHLAEHHLFANTLVLNPGALYRASPHSFAVVDLPDLVVRQIAVN